MIVEKNDNFNKEVDKIINSQYSSDLFQDQKKKINELKAINEKNQYNDNNMIINKNTKKPKNKSTNKVDNDNITTYENLPFRNKDLMITLEQSENWEFSSFDYDIYNCEEIPKITSPFWEYEESDNYNSENGVDIRNIILKSVSQFNLMK